MGCFGGAADPEQGLVSSKIDKQIHIDKKRAEFEFKMLLLGTGESGKSTILKQMQLIHGPGFQQSERAVYTSMIHGNTLHAMKQILDGMDRLGISRQDVESTAEHHKLIMSLPDEEISTMLLTVERAQAIRTLWRDAGVQSAYLRSNEYQVIDSAKYYFDEIDRTSTPDYIPSDADILRSRVKTTGIVETKFQIGQRSERKKWIHCFENVTAIIFLAAASEYDQVLAEDKTINRLQEAIALFDSICNARWFINTSIVLFLNKIDLFKEKLFRSSFHQYFESFPADSTDYDKAIRFLRKTFEKTNRSPQKTVYCHYTCATNTAQVKFVMNAVRDIIVKNNLSKAGLM